MPCVTKRCNANFLQKSFVAMRLSTPWPKSVCIKDSRLVSASFPLRLKMGKILFRELTFNRIFALKNRWLKNIEVGIH